MNNRKVVYGVLSIIILVSVVCGVVLYYLSESKKIKVAFLDVGQGDAVLVSKGAHQILIDGGPDSAALLEELGKQIPFWDRNIEIVVATHPDGDHIDGLISVFENYNVDQFWHTNADKDTSVNRKLLQSVAEESGVEDITAFRGLDVDIDGDIFLEVIYPFSQDVNDVKDVNDTSLAIVSKIAGEVFYLGGDLSSEIEDVLSVGSEITVLKAGHHGSNSSTSEEFLAKAKPRDVIISAGENNRHAHPHEEVLGRITKAEANTYRTDKNGTITYECDKIGCKVLLDS
ncbi:MAG: MBL fold metallo-hydrolase [Patescibacteria group bacterium]